MGLCMPFYEYKCKKCDEKITKLVKLDESNKPTECENCKGELEKKISSPSFKFVGSGFYQTDFKNK